MKVTVSSLLPKILSKRQLEETGFARGWWAGQAQLSWHLEFECDQLLGLVASPWGTVAGMDREPQGRGRPGAGACGRLAFRGLLGGLMWDRPAGPALATQEVGSLRVMGSTFAEFLYLSVS